MDEPSLRSSRLVIGGGLLAAIVLAGGGFLLGRTTLPRPEPEAPPAVLPPAVTSPPAEAPGALGRADILAMGALAADALASGVPPAPGGPDVTGRRFDLALPFGCEGSATPGSAAPLHWRYDADKQTLRIHVSPIRWEGGEWGLAAPDGTVPGLQGFWVSYPWTSSEHCPRSGEAVPESQEVPDEKVTSEGMPVAPAERTLALAEVLSGDAKQERRGDRPYEIVKRMAPERLDPKQGFRLRLKGRIERLPSGESVQCAQPMGVEHRPTCLVGISLDEVRIENPLDGEVLATWTTHLEERNAP